jgi:glutathionyl-hydroquinone reductase
LAPGETLESAQAKVFDKVLPKFLDEIEPICGNHTFLFGETLTTADFRVGGLYTDYINNK